MSTEYLKKFLAEADLPTDPKKIIGRVFQFDGGKGKYQRLYIGVITGLRVLDKSALQLLVSISEMWGGKLDCLQRNGKWFAHIGPANVQGEFKLL